MHGFVPRIGAPINLPPNPELSGRIRSFLKKGFCQLDSQVAIVAWVGTPGAVANRRWGTALAGWSPGVVVGMYPKLDKSVKLVRRKIRRKFSNFKAKLTVRNVLFFALLPVIYSLTFGNV